MLPLIRSPGFDPSWIETSPVNHYGETVVASIIQKAKNGEIYYRCRDAVWTVAHAAWCKAYRDNPGTPAPMSEGHCMFLAPSNYGCTRFGDDNPRAIRRALRNTVIANLDGWDRELRKSREGYRQLAKIVRGTVRAQMEGRDVGGAHFVACVLAGM